MLLQNLFQLMFILSYTHFLSQEQICALPNREKILAGLAQFDDVYSKMRKTIEIDEITSGENLHKYSKSIQGVYESSKEVKERLNECR